MQSHNFHFHLILEHTDSGNDSGSSSSSILYTRSNARRFSGLRRVELVNTSGDRYRTVGDIVALDGSCSRPRSRGRDAQRVKFQAKTDGAGSALGRRGDLASLLHGSRSLDSEGPRYDHGVHRERGRALGDSRGNSEVANVRVIDALDLVGGSLGVGIDDAGLEGVRGEGDLSFGIEHLDLGGLRSDSGDEAAGQE